MISLYGVTNRHQNDTKACHHHTTKVNEGSSIYEKANETIEKKLNSKMNFSEGFLSITTASTLIKQQLVSVNANTHITSATDTTTQSKPSPKALETSTSTKAIFLSYGQKNQFFVHFYTNALLAKALSYI